MENLVAFDASDFDNFMISLKHKKCKVIELVRDQIKRFKDINGGGGQDEEEIVQLDMTNRTLASAPSRRGNKSDGTNVSDGDSGAGTGSGAAAGGDSGGWWGSLMGAGSGGGTSGESVDRAKVIKYLCLLSLLLLFASFLFPCGFCGSCRQKKCCMSSLYYWLTSTKETKGKIRHTF